MFIFQGRFIIEKQNSFLKNKKALDNIRNVTVGHIMIDYRITCAMSNFLHVPCCPDNINSEEIANSIRSKVFNYIPNHLKKPSFETIRNKTNDFN